MSSLRSLTGRLSGARTDQSGNGGAKSLLSKSIPVALGTASSRLTGFFALATLGYALGFDKAADTYNLANTMPNVVYELLLGGVLGSTLVPAFVAARRKGDARAEAAVATAVVMVALVATLVGLLVGPLIIGALVSGASPQVAAQQTDVARSLLWLLMPQIFFYGAVAVMTAMLNARQKFAAAAFAPALANCIEIVLFIYLRARYGSLTELSALKENTAALVWLGGGTTLAVMSICLPMLIVLVRSGGLPRPVIAFDHPAVRSILRLSGWTVLYVAGNQAALFVILYLANRADGGVAIYQATFMFFQLPHGLLAVSLMTTLLPSLAASWSDGDHPQFRHRFVRGYRMMWLAMLPSAVGYLVVSHLLLSVLLHYGAVTTDNIDLASKTLIGFAIGLPFFSACMFTLRGFYAMHNTRIPFYLSLAQNGINVVVAVILVHPLGVPGVALAFSLSYIIMSVVALIVFARRAHGVILADTFRNAGSLVFASAAMAVAVWPVAHTDVIGPLPLRLIAAVAIGAAAFAAVGLGGLRRSRRSAAGTTSAGDSVH